MCGFGFVLAKHLGFRRALAMFVAVEVMLLFWIRDRLFVNVLVLIYPSEWIKQWQTGL